MMPRPAPHQPAANVQKDVRNYENQTEFDMDSPVVLEEWARLSGIRHG